MKFILEDLDFENFEVIDIKDKDFGSTAYTAPKIEFNDLFSFKSFINKLLKYGKRSSWFIYLFMMRNKEFYEKKDEKYWNYAMKKLIETKDNKEIYRAAKNWPHDKIDYNKVIEYFESRRLSEYLYYLALYLHPKEVDFKRLSQALCKTKDNLYIQLAKENWPEFYDCKTGERIK